MILYFFIIIYYNYKMKGGTRKTRRIKGRGPTNRIDRSHLKRSARDVKMNHEGDIHKIDGIRLLGVSKKKTRKLSKFNILNLPNLPNLNMKKKQSKPDEFAVFNEKECNTLKKAIQNLYGSMEGSHKKWLDAKKIEDKEENLRILENKLDKFTTFKDDLDILYKLYNTRFNKIYNKIPEELKLKYAPDYSKVGSSDKSMDNLADILTKI